MSFEQLLPSWLHFSLESDLVDSDAEAAGGQAVEPQDAQPLIPRCLVMPGGLHITHNLQTDMHQKLEWWDGCLRTDCGVKGSWPPVFAAARVQSMKSPSSPWDLKSCTPSAGKLSSPV